MKLERPALFGAVVALIGAGWCLHEIRGLQARLDGISGELPPLRSQSARLMAQPTNLEQRLKKLEAGLPDLGVIMSGIQLHFAKLYFAGEARNWELAQFERIEIEENLNTAAAIRPEERGVNLAAIIDAFKNTQLTALKDAIEVKDRGLLREAYKDSILMCNTCHQATGRPFISITIPTNPPVSNQRWEVPTDGAK